MATASTETPKAPAAKRGPGRPPGSRNKKPPGPIPAQSIPKPPTPPKSETERVAEAAKERASSKKDTPNAPDFTEWADFLGEVVLHWFSVAFLSVALRGLNYHEVFTPEDYEDVQLDDDELKAIARPFAHLLTHSKLNSKYGRMIMNSRDSIEAMVIFFMWMSRVRRIGNKYRRWIAEHQLEMESANVARIPRPDRARDSESETNGAALEPIPGIAHAAFGHGFN